MRDIFVQIWDTLKQHVPSALFALLILLGAWVVALGASALVRRALGRLKLEEKVARLTGQPDAKKVDTASWVARIVYYMVLLFGVIGFFNALRLPMVSAPFNRLLDNVFEFAPRLLGAAVLLVVAFVVATVVRMLVATALKTVGFDRRLGEVEGAEGALSSSIAGTLYWLVFLLFLPMILDALALEGLLEPVQTMLNRLLGFLPNLFAAGLILFFGWLAAKIVRQVVSNLLAAAGADRAMQRTGTDKLLGDQKLSGLVGVIVYVLILIPVAISALDALQLGAISEPAGQMLATILQAIPGIFTAALILFIAYTVGRFLSGLVSELLTRIGFDNLPARLGLGWRPAQGRKTPADMAGYLVLVSTLFFAAIEAARQLRFDALAGMLINFVEFGGHVLLGVVIFAVGLFLANLAASLIGASQRPERGLLAMIARVAVLVLAGAMALREMGVAKEIIEIAFGVTWLAVAVAAALAFGLGGRDAAGRAIDVFSRRIKGGD